MIIGIEVLLSTGPTAQIRCLAGFFLLLAFCAARSSDAQGSRRLGLTKDAFTGESILKTGKTWTKWFCNRQGFTCDWAALWLEELRGQGLPEPDFILWAPNSSCDDWLDRPASYPDLRRCLHFLLHMHHGMALDEAVTFNPHSFRHFLVESGQQLRCLKICDDADLERLGHWAKGSEMPNNYDNAAGVSELMARVKIMNALRQGWRPAREGEIPLAIPGSIARVVPVGHIGSQKIHMVSTTATLTLCRFWNCGSSSNPDRNALFENIPASYSQCRACPSGLHWGPQ